MPCMPKNRAKKTTDEHGAPHTPPMNTDPDLSKSMNPQVADISPDHRPNDRDPRPAATQHCTSVFIGGAVAGFCVHLWFSGGLRARAIRN
jgi:hypothetical protein